MKPFDVLKFARPGCDESGERMILIEDRGERVLVAAVGSDMAIVPTICLPLSEMVACDAAESVDAYAGIMDEIDRCGAQFPAGVENAARSAWGKTFGDYRTSEEAARPRMSHWTLPQR